MANIFEPNLIRFTHSEVHEETFSVTFSGSVSYTDAFGFRWLDSFSIFHCSNYDYFCTFYCSDDSSYQKSFPDLDSFILYCLSLG